MGRRGWVRVRVGVVGRAGMNRGGRDGQGWVGMGRDG